MAAIDGASVDWHESDYYEFVKMYSFWKTMQKKCFFFGMKLIGSHGNDIVIRKYAKTKDNVKRLYNTTLNKISTKLM